MAAKLIIHTGPKGAPANLVERALNDGRSRLGALGVVYPGKGRSQNGALKPVLDGRAKLAEWLANAAPNTQETVVISDASLWTRSGLTPLDAAVDVQLIVTLRRQDLVLEDAWFDRYMPLSQSAVSDETVKAYLARTQDLPEFNYDEKLRGLAAAFGVEAIKLNIVDETAPPHMAAINFCHLAGLPADDLVPSRLGSSLASLSPQVQMLLRILPIDVIGTNDRLALERAILELEESSEFSEDISTEECLFDEYRPAILDRFSAINMDVARRFLGRDSLFDESRPRPLPQPSSEALKLLVAPLILHLGQNGFLKARKN